LGEVIATAFSVPRGSLDYWQRRLTGLQVAVERSGTRFAGLEDEEVLTLADPDGMKIEIVGHANAGTVKAPRFSSVPEEFAIRGFFGVTLYEAREKETAETLGLMGFRRTAQEGKRVRFSAPGGALGHRIDLWIDPAGGHGRMGAGSVHHIAFRASDDAAQLAWRDEFGKRFDVTPVQDRTYFHSIYFREPGGVLFELATDPPGFALDEPLESLGEALRIPPWLEPRRAMIEARLATIALHKDQPPVAVAADRASSV
jgi:glyoxalase family protein